MTVEIASQAETPEPVVSLSRRSFLKTSSVVGGGLMVASWIVPEAAGAQGQADKTSRPMPSSPSTPTTA